MDLVFLSGSEEKKKNSELIAFTMMPVHTEAWCDDNALNKVAKKRKKEGKQEKAPT